MGKIQYFEELQAWGKARELSREIYRVSNHGKFVKDFGLRDQVRRASVSIMSNIAEGFERGGSKEFIQFLSLAKGSAGEIRSHLYVACDQSYVSHEEFDKLNSLVQEVGCLISGLMTYLKSSNLKGVKFK